MNFADFMSFEQYKKIESAYALFNNDTTNTKKELINNYNEAEEEFFNKPLLKFLEEYRNTVGLNTINYGTGHSTNVLQVWNKFVEGDKLEDYLQDRILNIFNRVMFHSLMNFKEEPLTEEYLYKKYIALTEKITNGNFSRYELTEDGCSCFDCGQKFRLKISNWVPEFNVIDFKKNAGKSTETIPESCLAKEVIKLPIEFKTGELLIADWFRIPEFTKAVKAPNVESINNSKGQIESTKYALENFNFITVHLGNCSPTIFNAKDALLFGREDEEEKITNKKIFKQVGSVCTDLWAVTIIEKEQLIKIISDVVGDKAKEIVEDYLKVNKFNIELMNIDPGVYNLKFSGNYHNFKQELKCEEEIQSNITPYFMLEKQKLINEHKPKIKTKI